MARIVMFRGPTPDTIYDLEGDVIAIGRGSRNDIVIQDNEISREHCRLIRVMTDYELQDLNSSNGTFVNGQRITQNWLLQSGHIIELGDTVAFEYQRVGGLDEVPEDIAYSERPAVIEEKAAPPPDAKYPYLIMAGGQQAGQVYPLQAETTSIGRDLSNDIVIQDPEVSRFHARLLRTEEGFVIEDLKSTNGTVVNSARLSEPKLLRPNDTIKIGTMIRFLYTWAPAEFKPEPPTETAGAVPGTFTNYAANDETTNNILVASSSKRRTSQLGTGLEPGALENHIFIAYAREEWEEVVVPLTVSFQEAGLDFWVDQYLIPGSDDWIVAVEQALSECWMLLLLVSPKSLNMRPVKMEYRYFYNREKPILPLIYKPVTRLPRELDNLRAIVYDNDNPTKSIKRVMLEILHMRE